MVPYTEPVTILAASCQSVGAFYGIVQRFIQLWLLWELVLLA